jgi:hypothetical protein
MPIVHRMSFLIKLCLIFRNDLISACLSITCSGTKTKCGTRKILIVTNELFFENVFLVLSVNYETEDGWLMQLLQFAFEMNEFYD